MTTTPGLTDYKTVHTLPTNGMGAVRFEWDSEKARRNAAKHGVTFELACHVFDDPLYLLVPDRFEDGEQRWHAIGLVGQVVILLVVHSYPDPNDEDHVRIIGARKATAHERRRYEQEGA